VPLNKKIIIIIIKVGCLGVMIGVFWEKDSRPI
jgi:hypothetical protein